MNPKVDRANDPEQWGEEWTDNSRKEQTGHVNGYYPTDGRDTVYPPYEQAAPTGTVGEYLAAAKRISAGDSTLPPHYTNYHAQRTSWPRDVLRSMDPDTPLDAKGNPVG